MATLKGAKKDKPLFRTLWDEEVVSGEVAVLGPSSDSTKIAFGAFNQSCYALSLVANPNSTLYYHSSDDNPEATI